MKLKEYVASKGCIIEDTTDAWEKVLAHEAPRYEVFAPDGKRFSGTTCHSLLCDSSADVREQLHFHPLEDCPDDCDCKVPE
jgi:hypothetical protein